MQLRINSDNEVSVYIMYSYIHQHTTKTETLSDEFISHNIHECFMNTKYLCACLEKIWYKFQPSGRLAVEQR